MGVEKGASAGDDHLWPEMSAGDAICITELLT
jgi:hypothetical protein